MSLPYKCLILDHDDTAVDSTASIHYPAHLEVMRVIRPGVEPVSLEQWWLKNFEPGIMRFMTEELGMNEEEIQLEYEIWRRFTTGRIPHFYPGFLETLTEFKRRGGKIAVVSHSEKDLIARDYREHDKTGFVFPDMIFGWDFDEAKRKPSPWPVERILDHFGIPAAETLIIDDLKPGVLMSKASGVEIAAAGWCHNIPRIRGYMEEHCLTYFSDIDQFRNFILASDR